MAVKRSKPFIQSPVDSDPLPPIDKAGIIAEGVKHGLDGSMGIANLTTRLQALEDEVSDIGSHLENISNDFASIRDILKDIAQSLAYPRK